MAKKPSVVAFYVFDKIEGSDVNPSILVRRREEDNHFLVISSYFKGNSARIESFQYIEDAIDYIQNNFLSSDKYRLIRVQ